MKNLRKCNDLKAARNGGFFDVNNNIKYTKHMFYKSVVDR